MVVGYGIKIFVPRPLHYVTRSPGSKQLCIHVPLGQKYIVGNLVFKLLILEGKLKLVLFAAICYVEFFMTKTLKWKFCDMTSLRKRVEVVAIVTHCCCQMS